MYENLAKSGRRIVVIATMVRAEVAQREAVEVPAMRGIAEGAEIRIVRSDDDRLSPRREQAVKFFHRSDNVSDMFYNMDRAQLPERAVQERKWVVIEVGQHIGSCVRVAIDTESAGKFIDPAAYVENGQRGKVM